MSNFFSADGTAMTIFGRITDFVWLNILFIVGCIPIFTIGASVSALYYVSLKMVKNEEGSITKDFFRSYKANLKQASIIWLILLALGIILGLDLVIMLRGDFAYAPAIIAVIMIPVFLLLFTLLYVFPVLSRFENTVLGTIKNALLMSVAHMPRTLLMAVLTYLPVIIVCSNLYLLPFLFFGVFAVIAFFNSYILNRVFLKYESKEDVTKVTE